jgi:circadian clock protein KaiB
VSEFGDDRAGPNLPDVMWHLKLYVAGASPKSLKAFENLRVLCEQHLAGRYKIEIIDLVRAPLLARTDDIVAVPTVVRMLPAPVRKVIGDLSDTQRVLLTLQVDSSLTQSGTATLGSAAAGSG